MSAPPLKGVRVLELAGLAPGPFAGLLLADYGADVLRIDQPSSSKTPTRDLLVRRKSSLAISLKTPAGAALFKELLLKADILIDPYRPGVLEKLGFGPEQLERINPRLIIARLTGFRRDGPYKDMAGHDINYIAVAGVLALLGREGEKPYAPGNLLADFAGGGLMCFTGILLALLNRAQSRRGQVVESNMVDGAAYLATFPRFAMRDLAWGAPRGQNLLDGGCPWYDTYETRDGQYVAVGCLEPQFYAAFLKGLGLRAEELPSREGLDGWPKLKAIFTECFLKRSRQEWEQIFDGTDACVTPVLTYTELEDRGFQIRPPLHLSKTSGLAVSNEKEASAPGPDNGQTREGQGPGVDGEGYRAQGLCVGEGGEDAIRQWLGWTKGAEYDVKDGGAILLNLSTRAKL